MKNKFLLLGATALLSTGALVAFATDPSVYMWVGVNIHRAGTLANVADLNFGSVIIPDNAKELHLKMDNEGTVTAFDGEGNPDSSVHVLGDAHFGMTVGAPCPLLSLPTDVSLGYPTGHSATGTASNFKCAEVTVGTGPKYSGISTDIAVIYAENLDITSTEALFGGQYSGSFSITAVYPE